MARSRSLLPAFLFAALVTAGPVLAQTEDQPPLGERPSVQLKKPAPTTVTPGKTFRLNDLEKRKIEEEKQREYEERMARAAAPTEPVKDPARELREGWWENPRYARDRDVLNMIRHGTIRQ